MRILITGITGFAGSYLTELLLKESNDEIWGLSRHAPGNHPGISKTPRLHLQTCDLCSPSSIEAVLRLVKPEQIYHLAGYANAGKSFKETEAAWSGNLTATRVLYEAIERWEGKPRILFVGSGLIYGQAEDAGGFQDETCLLRPTSPYAASKAAADLLSYQVSVNPGLEIVRARPYNHIGPRQVPSYAIPSFARQIVAIERGLQPPVLNTGNLLAERDLTDVRDVVRAYLQLMERGRVGQAYNIASGNSLTIQAVLEKLLDLAKVKVTIQQQSDLLRLVDQSITRVGIEKIRGEIGWKPVFNLEQTLSDILEFWRSQ